MQATLLKEKLVIIIVLFCHAALFGQAPVIKKVTEITFDYRFGDKPAIDTTINEYSRDGNEIQSSPKSGCGVTTIYIKCVKTITLDSTKQKIIRKNILSDSSITTTYQYNYKDSTIYFSIKNNDTIWWQKNLLKHKKVVSNIMRSRYEPYNASSVIKINFLRKKSTRTSLSDSGTKEIVKFSLNRVFNIRKERNYNPQKKEWFVAKKERFDKKGKQIKEVDQQYSDAFEIYYKTVTRYKYNSFGQVRLKVVVVKDHNKDLESKTIYLYEYY